MSKLVLDRRTFLRGTAGGIAISVALPPLEAMFDAHGTAYAGGAPIPTRFGVWFWGNGVRLAHWIPSGTGSDWTPGEELAPLAGVRPYVNVLTGYEIKTATHPHHSGMTGIMTGAHYHQVGTTRDTIVSTFAHPSIDQVVAQQWAGRTPYRSLEVGVCRFRGTDEGTTFEHLSHNGPNNPNPSEYTPQNVFARLFSGRASSPHLLSARRSVLDSVVGQVTALKGRLGARDRARLDQHLESVRALEGRLAGSARRCPVPAAPAADYPDLEGREQIEEKNRAMSDLVALALACDLTRVFSVMFSCAGSGVVVWQAGATDSLHYTCHVEPEPQPVVHQAITFTMRQLAYFLEKLRDTPAGPEGNLLDHSVILCTSELSEGNRHNNDEFPLLTAGLASGRLRGGLHHRVGRENASKVLLTVLRAAGLPMDGGFGYDAGHVSETVGAIQT